MVSAWYSCGVLKPGRLLDLRAGVELGAVVRGDGDDPARIVRDALDHAFAALDSSVSHKPAQHRAPGGALRHRDRGVERLGVAFDRMDLPVSGCPLRFGFVRFEAWGSLVSLPRLS